MCDGEANQPEENRSGELVTGRAALLGAGVTGVTA